MSSDYPVPLEFRTGVSEEEEKEEEDGVDPSAEEYQSYRAILNPNGLFSTLIHISKDYGAAPTSRDILGVQGVCSNSLYSRSDGVTRIAPAELSRAWNLIQFPLGFELASRDDQYPDGIPTSFSCDPTLLEVQEAMDDEGDPILSSLAYIGEHFKGFSVDECHRRPRDSGRPSYPPYSAELPDSDFIDLSAGLLHGNDVAQDQIFPFYVHYTPMDCLSTCHGMLKHP